MAVTDPGVDPIKSSQAANAVRDLSGKFSKLDPPFISFSITNPVTYIRKWWKGVMDGEGVDLRLKIHPMTAVLIILAVGGASFGIGRISFPVPEPILQYIPILANPLPTASPNPWQPMAMTGTLQKQAGTYFLIGQETQAIRLELPSSLELDAYLGKRILASGEFDKGRSVLQIESAANIEVLVGSIPIRSPKPTSTPLATSSAAISY